MIAEEALQQSGGKSETMAAPAKKSVKMAPSMFMKQHLLSASPVTNMVADRETVGQWIQMVMGIEHIVATVIKQAREAMNLLQLEKNRNVQLILAGKHALKLLETTALSPAYDEFKTGFAGLLGLKAPLTLEELEEVTEPDSEFELGEVIDGEEMPF